VCRRERTLPRDFTTSTGDAAELRMRPAENAGKERLLLSDTLE
jgi:hypothetical protein